MNKRISLAALMLVLTAAALLWRGADAQSAPDLFFSEYIEGSSNNKALEIYNGTGAAVDLAATGYSVQMFFNGSAAAGLTINLVGTVAAGDVFVLAQSSSAAAILAQADQTNGAGWFNGDDAVVLLRNGVVLDAIGQIGFDPGTEWGTGLVSTADNTLRRNLDVCNGDAIATDPFDPAAGWSGFATDSFDGLGAHAPACGGPPGDSAPAVSTVSPANGASDAPADVNVTVTFNEPVVAGADAFTLVCAGAVQTFTLSGDGTTFVLDPVANLPQGELCTLTVAAASVTDQDVLDPPDAMAADFTATFAVVVTDLCTLAATPIPVIQGSGPATPFINAVVTTRGVVVADYEGPTPALRGFYLQDPVGDGDSATSDGVFVFNGNADNVNPGDLVTVRGVATEFSNQTQINAQQVATCGAGTVAPTLLNLPFASTNLEPYEGMLVFFPQTLYVTEHFNLGRFGEVLLSSDGRLYQPTHLVPPGPAALAQQDENLRNRILLDDARTPQNLDPIYPAPGLTAANTLRLGDAVDGLTGVLGEGFGAYRVQPVGAVNFATGNPRPAPLARTPGSLAVVSANTLNYFVTIDAGAPICGPAGNQECRGADSAFEFDRQRAKTLSKLSGLDADITGLIEIENSPDDRALVDLANGLNAMAGATTYSYVATGAIGTDAIRVGFLYKPAVVQPVGAPAVLTSAFDARFLDDKNRPVLAQTFEELASGNRFTVALAHLKSKGSDCVDVGDPDQNDGQGNCNLTRKAAAEVLAAWLATDPTQSGDPDFLIIGDLNSYAKEDPITALRDAGFTNLVEYCSGDGAYSYVFDGQSGYLDHALANASLTPSVLGTYEWHINADEPRVLDYNVEFKTPAQVVNFFAPDAFRTSDHDPLLVEICMAPQLHVTVTPDLIWPPNGKYVIVKPEFTTSPNATVSLLAATSSDPDRGLWRGDRRNDIVIRHNGKVALRAERIPGGPDRTYTLTYRAVNACGAETIAAAEVVVPANRPHHRFLDADLGVFEESELDQIDIASTLFLPLIDR
jgi:predicted extracellular nuclease